MFKWYYCYECEERVHISVLQKNEGLCDVCAAKRNKEEVDDDADNRD